jgi:prepilin-type N-terminal cleavage/methylation domain-containing protein
LRVEKGFTLIKLSIVIVIIGLIVAGVVGGQAWVQQANIRGLISDINKYTIALYTFKLEYNAISGDMRMHKVTGRQHVSMLQITHKAQSL